MTVAKTTKTVKQGRNMPLEVVERWCPLIRGLDEGVVYQDASRMLFVTHWRGMDLRWVGVVRVGAQGGLKGARLVLDPKGKEEDRILVCKGFSAALDGPFPLLENRLVQRRALLSKGVFRSPAERETPTIPLAQARAQLVLSATSEMFRVATAEEFRAQLTWLRFIRESDTFPIWLVQGETPRLSKVM